MEFEGLWRDSAEENARRLVKAGMEGDSRDALAIRTVLEAKLLDASRTAAIWTKRLAWATVALAAATVALAVVATFK